MATAPSRVHSRLVPISKQPDEKCNELNDVESLQPEEAIIEEVSILKHFNIELNKADMKRVYRNKTNRKTEKYKH